MSHPEELLSAFLDGEVSDPESLRVVDHLRSCLVCREELAEIQTARSAVRSLPVVDLPWASITQEMGTIARRGSWRRTWLAGAAAAVIITIGTGVATRPAPTVVDLDQLADQHAARVIHDPAADALRAANAVSTR